jgi:hypothetical protein
MKTEELLMIWKEGGILELEDAEPAAVSCWLCNPANEAKYKNVSSLHHCFWCDRYWVFGAFLDFDSFDSPEDMDKFFRDHGLEPGGSTTRLAVTGKGV